MVQVNQQVFGWGFDAAHKCGWHRVVWGYMWLAISKIAIQFYCYRGMKELVIIKTCMIVGSYHINCRKKAEKTQDSDPRMEVKSGGTPGCWNCNKNFICLLGGDC